MAGTLNLGTLRTTFAGDLAPFNKTASEFTKSVQSLSKTTQNFSKDAKAFDVHAQAAKNAVAPVNALNKVVSASTSQVKNLSSAYKTFHPAIQNVSSAFSTFTSKMQASHSSLQKGVSAISSFSGGMLRAIPHTIQFGKNLAELVVYSKEATQMAIGFVSSLFAQNAAMEQTSLSFVGLMGSTKAANDMLEKLKKFAALTPFEFPELAQDAQMLMGVGLEASKVIPWLTAIGDAGARMGLQGEGINRMTIALVQMTAKGKITGEEMMQLTENKIPVWNILAKEMGKSTRELMEMSQQGKLGADAIEKLVMGMEKFGKGEMSKQALTFNGLMSTLRDNAGQLWVAFMGGAFEKAKGGLAEIVKLMDVDKIKPFVEQMGAKLSEAISAVVQWVGKAYENVKKFFEALNQNGGLKIFVTILDQLKNIVTTAFTTAFQLFSGALGGVGANGDKAALSAQGVADSVKAIAANISGVLAKIQEFVKAFGEAGIKGDILRAALVALGIVIAAFKITSFVLALIPVATALWGAVVATWAFTAALLANPITWVVIAVVALIAIIVLLVMNWDKVVAFLRGAWDACVQWFSGTLNAIGQWWNNLWSGVANFFVGIWNSIVSFITGVLTGISNFFIGIWTGITNFVSGVWNGIVTIATNVWTAVSTAIMTVVNAIVLWITQRFVDFYNAVIKPLEPMIAWFQTLFSAIWQIIFKIIEIIVAFIAQKFNEAKNFIVSILTAAWNFIKSVFDSIYSTVSTIVTNVWTFLVATFTSVSNFITSIFTTIYNAISKAMADIWNAISSMLQTIWRGWVNIWNAVSKFVSDVWNTMYNTVSSWINKIWTTITTIFNNVKNSVVSVWNAIVKVISDAMSSAWKVVTDFVGRIFKAISDKFNEIKKVASDIWKSVINGIIDMLNKGIGAVRGFLNAIADGINNVANALGLKDVKVGRADWLKDIPRLASGTDNFKGGPALVGERGPEMVVLPKKTQVIDAIKTKSLMGNVGTASSFAGKGGASDKSNVPKGIGGFNPLDFLSTIWSSILSGAANLGKSLLGALGINLDNIGGGIFGTIVGGLGSMLGNFLGDWIKKILPTASGANLPMATRGEFTLPPGGGFHEQIWYGIHQGMDFAFPQGSPLTEAIGGMVKGAGWFPWGGEIDVQLANGLTERYLHLSALFAKVGDFVRRGSLIGLTGGGTPASGLGYWSTGSHLHYQVDSGTYGTGINPLQVWKAFGIFKPFAKGGVISEPVVGFGMRSGAGYSFAERGPETVTPGVGGDNNAILTSLQHIERLLSGGYISEQQIIQALGKILASGVR